MPSPTVAFAERVRAQKLKNPRLIDLAGGDVSISGPPAQVRDGGLAHFGAATLREPYPRIGGNIAKGGLVEAYRQFLWRQTGQVFTNSQVLVTPGAKQGIHLALQAIASALPGSQVVIFKPFWPSFEERVRRAGLVPVIIDCNPDGSANMDLLEKHVGSGVSAIILNNPRNPDGYVYSRSELAAIAELTLRFSPECVFIADEVYQLNLYAGTTFVPLSTVLPEGTRHISLFSLSKAFAGAGLRVGFASGDARLIEWMSDEQASTTGGVANVLQVAALGALSEHGLLFPAKLMDTIEAHSRRIVAWSSDTPYRVKRPAATIYCCLDVSAILGRSIAGQQLGTAHDVATVGVEDFHVAGMFGDPFGDPNMLRLNLAQVESNAVLDEALARLAALAIATN